MYWEINVAKDGQHLFATAERSLTHESKAAAVLDMIKKAFPESEGFSITCTRWEAIGRTVTPKAKL